MPDPRRALTRYRLITRLGGGGMAEVYLAVTSGTAGFRKLEVLKMPRSDLEEAERLSFLRMFQDEAWLAALLNHPNIIQSHDLAFDGDCPFITMEFLEGQSLDRVLARSWTQGNRFPLHLQLFVLSQVIDGLEYAHSLTDHDGTPLRIVHRDVSPQNVFITYSGHTKLLDFGVAKTLGSAKTQAGVVKGKIGYMAPEQLRGGAIDRRADLFSVGVMLWEAVAGRQMHREPNLFEIAKRLTEGDLPRLRDVAPGVSAPLERIVSRALAPNPDDRYADARSLQDDLRRVPEAQNTSARDVGERVSEMFAEERQALNEIIREAVRGDAEGRSPAERLDACSTAATSLPLARAAVHATTDPSSESNGPITVQVASPLGVQRAARPAPSNAPARAEPRPPSSTPTWLIGGALAVALLALLAVVTKLVLGRGTSRAAANVPEQALVAPPPSPNEAPGAGASQPAALPTPTDAPIPTERGVIPSSLPIEKLPNSERDASSPRAQDMQPTSRAEPKPPDPKSTGSKGAPAPTARSNTPTGFRQFEDRPPKVSPPRSPHNP